jgi:hypothetical protein
MIVVRMSAARSITSFIFCSEIICFAKTKFAPNAENLLLTNFPMTRRRRVSQHSLKLVFATRTKQKNPEGVFRRPTGREAANF